MGISRGMGLAVSRKRETEGVTHTGNSDVWGCSGSTEEAER